MRLASPDLSGSPTWQSATGFTVEIAECMANFGSAYANLYVFVYDHDQGRLRAFFSGTAQALTHDVYGDATANWNHLEFDWSGISTFPTNYTIQQVAIYIWGRMTGVYYEGGVYVDEVTPLAAEQPQPPAAPSNLRAYQTVPQIHLTWEDNSEEEDGFRLEYKRTRGVIWPLQWDSLATVGSNVTSFQWDSARVGDTYVFRVAAFNANGLSSFSVSDSLQYRIWLSYLRLDSPNGGEVWPVGSLQQIVWTAHLLPFSPFS